MNKVARLRRRRSPVPLFAFGENGDMKSRRRFLATGAATASVLLAPTALATSRPGRLIAIGGGENRGPGGQILQRFIELSGGNGARIVALTAASIDPQSTGENYRRAFAALGVTDFSVVDARDRAATEDPQAIARLAEADGIFITGGDQRRLMASIGDSRFAQAMRWAFQQRGTCIAGTSAGAAALSRSMLAEGSTPPLPEKDAARLDLGLGLVPKAIIDQHFSERRRLGRLLSVVAQQPSLLGVGIDEDTALVIERGRGIEVIGEGSVTVLDGRLMRSNIADADSRERLEMLGIRLHLLPAGNRYGVVDGIGSHADIPPSLRQAISLLVEIPQRPV